MAGMTGQLLADFTDFTRAVDTAVVTLKGFETGASKVEGSLNRMVDNFSGRKIIQDATLMAEAVERIGGSSKLTDAELQKIGRTASEAADKLRAMGQAVPPQIEALAKQFKGLEDNTKGATTSFSSLVGSFVAADVILKGAEKAFDAIVGLVKELGQLALEGSAVSDVAGNFQHLTEEAGRLGDTLLGTLRAGTHNTISDFELMKVANQDLAAGMNLTDAQFATLAEGAFALAQATGTDVKQGFDVMNEAMLTGKARALSLLTGKIDLKAAEEAYAATLGTTADRLTDDEKLLADRQAMLDAVATATGRLGEQTDGLDERVAQAQTSWENFRLSLGRSIAESKTLEAGFGTLRTSLIEAFGGNQQALIDSIVQAVNKAAIVVVDFALAAIEGARLFNAGWSLVKTIVLGVEAGLVTMSAAATEAYARIAQGAAYLPGATEATRQWAASARTTADEMWNLAKALDNEAKEAFKGVTGNSELDKTFDKLGGVLFQVRDAFGATTTATATHTEATKGAAAAADEDAAATGRQKRAKEDLDAVMKTIGKMNAEIVKQQQKEEEAGVLGLSKTTQDEIQKVEDAKKRASAEINRLNAEERDFAMKSTMDSTAYQIAKVQEAAAKKVALLEGTSQQIATQSEIIMRQAAREADSIIASASRALDVVAKKGMDTLALLDLVGRQVKAGMAVDVVGNAQAVGGSGVGMQAPIYVAPPIFARAAGGPVSSGQPYLVGEQGPELFVPSASGGILPNGGGGSMVVNINVTQPLGTPAQIAAVVGKALMQTLRQQGTRMPSGA